MVADDGHIVRYSHNRHRILVHELEAAVRHLLHVGVAVEFDVDGFIRLAILPCEAVLQPVIRDLDLRTVDDLLLEQAVLITDAAAMARQAMRRHGVDEAGCETAEAAVAEAGIRLLLERIRQGEVEVLQYLLHGLLDTEIHEVALEQTAHEELDGEVVDLLLLTLRIGIVRLDPVIGDELLRHRRNGLIDLIRRQLVHLAAPHDMCRLDELVLELLLELLKLFALGRRLARSLIVSRFLFPNQ